MVKSPMIEEIGTVIRLDGVSAIVSVPKKSACDGCTAGTCKPEDRGMEIEAINRAGAGLGQRVRITIHTYPYMQGSMIVYGIPALFLVIGAVFGKEVLSGILPDKDPDLLSAFAGFGALLISFLVIKAWSRFRTARTETQPVIEEVLE